MTLDEIMVSIFKAYQAPIQVRQENTHAFRAGFGNDWDSSLTSECRETPEAAIRRFHEKLLARAEEGLRIANEHRSKLLTRIEPKVQPGPSLAGSQGDDK